MKDFEKKPILKKLKDLKKEKLLQIKKEYNSYRPKICNLEQKMRKMDFYLEKYHNFEKENINKNKNLTKSNFQILGLKKKIEFLHHKISIYKKKKF